MAASRLLVVFCVLPLFTVPARAQVSHTCPNGPSTVGDCSSSGGGNGGIVGLFNGILNPSAIFNNIANAGAIAARQRAQQRAQQAYGINQQGIAAENRGDWLTALKDFQSALSLSPQDGQIRKNLGAAQGQLGIEAYNRQDWATAINLFRADLANNPGDPSLPAWLQLAQQNYQNLLAQQRQNAVDQANRETEALRKFEEQQAAEAKAAEQRKDQGVADGVQQTMRDFLATLDQSSDVYRLGSKSVVQTVAKDSSASPSGAGLTFMSASTDAPASDPAATDISAGGATGLQFLSATSMPAAPASSAAATAPANPPAPGLQFMPAGEIHDAAVDAPAKGPDAAPAQENGSTSAGAQLPQNVTPLAVAPLPAAPLATASGAKAPDFDQRNTGQTAGPAAPGLVFQPTAVAAAPATGARTPQAQPAAAPQALAQPAPGGLRFENSNPGTSVDLRATNDPSTLRPANLKHPAEDPAPVPSPAAPLAAAAVNPLQPLPPGHLKFLEPEPQAGVVQFPSEDDLRFLFDAAFPNDGPQWPGPKDPNYPLINPLREQAQFQQDLKRWDDWAFQTALDRTPRTDDFSYVGSPAQAADEKFHSEAVQKYAPEVFERYRQDEAFHHYVDVILLSADFDSKLDYYQGIANAHKAAILASRDGLRKLEDAGELERGMGIPDQEQRHPAVIPKVQAVYVAATNEEDAEVARARTNAGSIIDGHYRSEFDHIQQRAVAESK